MEYFHLFLLVVMVMMVSEVKGHGRMIDPPQRSTAWRYGFDTPPNFTDMGLNCGGTSHQWIVNGGKCGACGDPYDAVQKPNQTPGGKYVTGTIVRSYESSKIIDIKIELTAYHKGYFEFRICPLDPGNGKETEVTMDCLNEYQLEVGRADQSEDEFVTRYSVEGDNAVGSQGTGIYNLKVKLPEGLVCNSCVMQWIWHGGNSWGCDADGACGLGKGPQENFWNCADVEITSSSTASMTPSPTTYRPPSTTKATTQMPTTTTTTKMPTTTKTQTTLKPTTTPLLPTTTTKSLDDDIDTSSCVGASGTSNSTMDALCKIICQVPEDCLPEMCICFDFCRSKLPASFSDQTCKDLCRLSPAYCESDLCSCYQTDDIPTTTPKPPSSECDCVGVFPFDAPYMHKWCCDNCKRGNCPKSHCACTSY
ncbi:uncharacterized protein LOC127835722 [Dreissena polymorpha]|uniref:Chitin-binding type-4 domain-containing protein n=1 Tax=Dreissena polymorpha TaxID=45954 RepID=A0A9D4G9N0_DREPO|nr:uncharacterized protein LOC127835722 [Dreissena polymorpha]KAH3809987.1 hypothetical protein DPMN_138369 [Dreissena polymorpha]